MTAKGQQTTSAAEIPESDDRTEAENRIAQRHVTSYQVGLMQVGANEDFCRVRNISATGLMAHVYRPLAVGDEVSVELKSGQVLHGHVAWTADRMPELASRVVHEIGVKFRDLIEVEPILSSQVADENGALQRWPRIIVASHLRLLTGTGRHLNGQLCDISQGGAKVRTSHDLRAESESALLLRGLPPLHARIRWTRDMKTGLSFDRPIDLETLIQWIQDRRAEPLASQARNPPAIPGTSAAR